LTPAEIAELLSGPALSPPNGQTSNLVDPKSLGIYVIPAAAATISVTGTVLLMRLYTRSFGSVRWGKEDYAAILAWMLIVAECVPSIYCSKHGGAHTWDTTLQDLFDLLYYAEIAYIIYGPTIFFIKLSILLQYLRIFVPSRASNMRLFVAIHTIIWTTLLFYTIDTFIQIFLCSPRAYFWNRFIVGGHCLNLTAALKATGLFNVFSDFAIFLLPMPTIWNLNLTYKKKLGLIGIFGTGLLACAFSIIRVFYTFRLASSNDTSYYAILLGLWGIAEVAMGYLCVCLPVIPQFFKIVRPKIIEFTSRSRSSTLISTFNQGPSKNSNERSKNSAKWKDPYDPRNILNSNYTELEDWERATDFKENHATVTSRGHKVSQEALEEGQIMQTISFDVEAQIRNMEGGTGGDSIAQLPTAH